MTYTMLKTREPETTKVRNFLCDNLLLENIKRPPTDQEFAYTCKFISLKPIIVEDIIKLHQVYSPSKPLRDQKGMNARVEKVPGTGVRKPLGGPKIYDDLVHLVTLHNTNMYSAWEMHVKFNALHPFMGDNGVTGRTLWLWHTLKTEPETAAVPFLQTFYYQTIENIVRYKEK